MLNFNVKYLPFQYWISFNNNIHIKWYVFFVFLFEQTKYWRYFNGTSLNSPSKRHLLKLYSSLTRSSFRCNFVSYFFNISIQRTDENKPCYRKLGNSGAILRLFAVRSTSTESLICTTFWSPHIRRALNLYRVYVF